MSRSDTCLGRTSVDGGREVRLNVRPESGGSGVIQSSNQERVAV